MISAQKITDIDLYHHYPKKQTVPIRKLINGAPVSSINPATLRNPDCLEEYVNLGEKMRAEEEGMTV